MTNALEGRLEDAGLATQIMSGDPIPFEVNGETYYIRQPGTEEYDDALMIQDIVRRRVQAQPEVKALQEVPCFEAERVAFQTMIDQTQEVLKGAEMGSTRQRRLLQRLRRLQEVLEQRTAADEVADERAMKARDRYLCMRLLLDSKRQAVFDCTDPDLQKVWDAFSMAVKNDARPAIWLALQLVEAAPFSDRPVEPSSA